MMTVQVKLHRKDSKFIFVMWVNVMYGAGCPANGARQSHGDPQNGGGPVDIHQELLVQRHQDRQEGLLPPVGRRTGMLHYVRCGYVDM
jgi:hypothetical protein